VVVMRGLLGGIAFGMWVGLGIGALGVVTAGHRRRLRSHTSDILIDLGERLLPDAPMRKFTGPWEGTREDDEACSDPI
jgi:hypothetical protein